MDEFGWIAKYLQPLATDKAALGLADDAAFLENPKNMVVAADAMVENVHYLPDMHPTKLAKKLLAVNLSDMAAMGATPRYYTLTGALKNAPSDAWARDFCAGLAEMHEVYGFDLLGGDTTSTSGADTFSVTMMGEVDAPLRRNAAQVGDDVWVSGHVGAGYLGLLMAKNELKNGDPAWLTAYETPTPQIALGQALVAAGITCAIDISDGLVSDLTHICKASDLSAEIAFSDVPITAAEGIDPLTLLSAGDDYQLIFTTGPEKRSEISQLPEKLTRIGTLTASTGTPTVHLHDDQGAEIPLKQGGFTHF